MMEQLGVKIDQRMEFWRGTAMGRVIPKEDSNACVP